jgi:broad specificity phosphatase PhoE
MVNPAKSSGTRILLIRHGETEWNRTHRFQGRSDVPLNQRGKDQGHALALALKDEPIQAIYSSPLTRAMETARLIKVFHPSASLFEEDGLIEMDLGEFDGMDAMDWSSRNPEFRKAWLENPASVTMPGGESLSDVQGRAARALDRITAIYPPGSTLLLCSHNFVNLTLLCYALEIPLDRFRELRQEPAALNILYMQGQRLRAEVVNECSHLKEDLKRQGQFAQKS